MWISCLTCIQCPAVIAIVLPSETDETEYNITQLNIIGSNQTEILLSPSDIFVFFYALSISNIIIIHNIQHTSYNDTIIHAMYVLNNLLF